MAQQPQASSQTVFGPVNQGGDVLHIINNANAIQGWVDKNNMTNGISGVVSALQGGVVAQTAAAAAGTITFASTLNLPGNSAYEQVPFTVKASGWLTLNGGTYTATVQPLIYASTTSGYTASAAAAVLSTAAVSLTIAVAAAATLTTFPWEAEVTLVGNTSGGILGGRIPAGAISVGPAGAVAPVPLPAAPAAITNSPTAINLATATPPLQFLVGIVTVGATISAANFELGSFFLES